MRGLTILAPNEARNASELAVWGLAGRGVMTFRQLHSLIGKIRGGISHQGLSKALQELVRDGVVSKVAQGEYAINPAWVRNLRAFCDIVERNHKVLAVFGEVIV